MNGMKKAKETIENADTILVSGHINPDGDSIGSLLSLGLALESVGKKVYMVSVDGVPPRYRKLPGSDKIIRKFNKEVDLAISVDCSNKEILGDIYRSFESAKHILEIDHHDFRRPFGDISLIDNQAASVGEMIYSLLKEMDIEITRNIAQNLITSIIVETNSFKLPNVRQVTFEACAKLTGLGIDFYTLVDTVFWSKRKEAVTLSGVCLSRCEFLMGGKIVWSIVHKKDFEKTNARYEDVDGVPDEMRSIKTVKVALLFREQDDKYLRVSLRSKDKINVAEIAERYGGGGHFDVAGCSIPNSKKSLTDFLRNIERLFD